MFRFMSHPITVIQINHWCRILFWIVMAVWLGTLPFVKPVAQRIDRPSNLSQRLVFLVGLYLLFATSSAPFLGSLNGQIFTVTVPIALTGFIIAACGAAFGIWARLTIGSSWSASPSILQDHELILRGPYRLVRHPIYTSFLAMLLGAALQYGQLRSLLAVFFCAAGLLMKIAIEEQLMVRQFGERYLQYRSHVRALVPFVY